MSQNKKVCVNLGRAPSNLGNAQKKRYFCWDSCLSEIKFIVKMLDGWSKCPLYIYIQMTALSRSEISENQDDLWPVHANVAAGGRHKERESPEEAGVHRRGEKRGRDGNSHLASRIVC